MRSGREERMKSEEGEKNSETNEGGEGGWTEAAFARNNETEQNI